ncbi:MAG: hypothetical protein CSB47_05060 [Proteobacteria bacterium]|nr:MAG: hypothetical protein CSB47_05060 [Pseudomonadota bacterium]
MSKNYKVVLKMVDHSSMTEKRIRVLNKRSIFTLFLTWLALFFTVVGIAAGYKNFLRVHDQAKQATRDAKIAKDLLSELARKDVIQTWQQQVREQLEASRQRNARELAELKAVSNTSSYIASTLDEQVRQLTLQQEITQSPQKQANQWKAEEVRYLLRVASHKIQLDEDPRGAEKALLLADQLLLDVGLLAFLPVREAIAQDIAALRQVTPDNDTDLISHIDELAIALKSLMPAPPEVRDTAPSDASDNTEGRNSLLAQVRESISDVVVIQKYDQTLAKRINGDTQAVRFELLRLKLENLKLLALQGQEAAYTAQLRQIRSLIETAWPEAYRQGLADKWVVLERFRVAGELPKLKSPAMMDTVLSRPHTSGADT